MIPTEDQVRALWDKYSLPERKRRHCELVAIVAKFLATQLKLKNVNFKINEPLLVVAAMLHDIDKNIQKLPGEQHPDAAVRILREEGMAEVADLVKTHPLHAILDPTISPKTWEEKILFLADKMVKYEILTVDKRFNLWRAEDLPEEALDLLEASYPKVKKLEEEVLTLLGMTSAEIAKTCKG